MELFKQRLKEVFYTPFTAIVFVSAMLLILSPFFIVEYFFEGLGIGLLFVALVGIATCRFINWLIVEPFFKNKK